MRKGPVGLPWSIQVELVEGCTRACSFCGLNAIRPQGGNYKRMPVELARRLARECGSFAPAARYEFAMHGEPLLHPRATEIFALFRAALPTTQLQVTTNGATLRGRMATAVPAILASGIDFILLDTYAPERDALWEEAYGVLPGLNVRVMDFYREMAPAGDSPYHNHGRALRETVILMDDLGTRSGEVGSRVIMNHAGNALDQPVPEVPYERTCTIPFRELSLRWDGTVAICCNDWGGEYRTGDAATESLASIWWGAPFEAARRALYARDRRFSPCANCDERSGTRPGLLPKYGPVTSGDRRVIYRTLAAGTGENGFPPRLHADLTPPGVEPLGDRPPSGRVVNRRRAAPVAED